MRSAEPVAFQGIVQAVLLAFLAVGETFNLFTLSEDQVNALLGLFVALSLAWTFYTRSKVTPTSSL